MEGFIDIYSKAGQLKLQVPITAKSNWKKELMSEEYITLYFSSRTYVAFDRGDYAVWNDKTWYVIKKTFPKQSKKEGFDYELRLDDKTSFWQHRIFMYDRQGAKEGYWKLTGTAVMFLQIVVSNIAGANLGTYNFTILLDDVTVAKYLQFESVSIWDGLTSIAEAFDAEWWVSGNTIFLGKCELGTNFTLTDEHVETTSRSNSSDETYLTRIYPLGSTRNIPTDYRPEVDQAVAEGIVEKRLKLPSSAGDYVDAWQDLATEDIVEGFVIFDDVFPKRTGTISQVIVKEVQQEDEEGNTKTVKIYRFKDSGLSFDESYILAGETLEASFESGDLNGRKYELKFNPLGVEKTHADYNMFEIIINSNYGVDTPNDIIKPAVGDKYVLSGFNISLVSDQYVTAAEQELLEVSRDYVELNGIYKSVYDCTMKKVRCAGFVNGVYSAQNRVSFDIGQKILLKTLPYFGQEGLESRVRGFDRKLANIYEATYTIGDADKYSKIGALSAEVHGISLGTAVHIGQGSGGTSIYLIKQYDQTTPSDYNAFSAARAKDEFLSKKFDDTADGQITFNRTTINKNGTQFGQSFIPGLVGQGGLIDGQGRGELRSLKLWEWLEVPELRYNKVSVFIGIQMVTFGGGIIETITPNEGLTTGSGTLKLDEGEIGAIAVGDLCMGIWHDQSGNADANSDDNRGNFTFAGFKTVYFQITAVSGSCNENFSYVLRSTLEGGNGVHPFEGMHFAGRGNISNIERQAFTYSTTEYSLSLVNVNTWEFQPANYYEIHGKLEGFSMPAVDKDGNPYTKVFHGYGQVFGNAYLFGQIDQFERIAYRCFIEQSLGGSLAPGETEQVTVSILNGYGEDVTQQFTHYAVTRNSGDDASDALWNAQHTSVNNPFNISFSDLGIDGIRRIMTVFTVTATDEVTSNSAQATADYFS